MDAQALLVEAKKIDLEKDPDVQRSVRMAEDRALASALLNKVVRPQVTEEAVKAKYDEEFANKPGEPKKVFLSQGEDVFIAAEGDIIDRRYKVSRITAVSVEVEDVLNNNRQSIPLTQAQ